MKKNTEIRTGLVAGRHTIPVDSYIFESISFPVDFAQLDNVADDFIRGNCIPRLKEDYDTGYSFWRCEKSLTIYVTGYTPALVAVIKACASWGCHLTLMHYNPTICGYEPQIFGLYA